MLLGSLIIKHQASQIDICTPNSKIERQQELPPMAMHIINSAQNQSSSNAELPSPHACPQMRFQQVVQEIGIKAVIHDSHGSFPSATAG